MDESSKKVREVGAGDVLHKTVETLTDATVATVAAIHIAEFAAICGAVQVIRAPFVAFEGVVKWRHEREMKKLVKQIAKDKARAAAGRVKQQK